MSKRRCRISKPTSYKTGGSFHDEQLYTNNVNPNNTNPYSTGETKGIQSENIGKSAPIVDKKDATIEAEKGEYILKADGKLYGIGGKPHSKGGSPIIAEEGDFIFSDFIKIGGESLMYVSPDTKEKSKDFKKGKTPADLIKKFKLNKLNDYIAKLESDDPFARKTAQSSIEGINKKLAEIALVQEQDKGMPNGMPVNLAEYLPNQQGENGEEGQSKQNELPIKGQELQLKAKYGGSYPKLKKAQKAGEILGDPLTYYSNFIPGFKENYETNKDKMIIPEFDYTNSGSQKKAGKYYGDITDDNQRDNISSWYKRQTGSDIDFKNANQVEDLQLLYNSQANNYFGIDYNSGINSKSDGAYGNRTNSFIFGKESLKGLEEGKINLNEFYNLPEQEQFKIAHKYGLNIDDIEKYRASVVNELNITGPGEAPTPGIKDHKDPLKGTLNSTITKEYKDFGYTKAEKLALANSVYGMFDNPMFPPQKTQVNPRYITSQKVDSQSAENQLSNQTYRAGKQQALTMAPQLAAANMSSMMGRLAEGVGEIKGQYDNANAQIYNQTTATNTDIANQFEGLNAQYSDRYNTQVNQMLVNHEAETDAARNAAVETFGQIDPRRHMRNSMYYAYGPKTFPIESAEGIMGFNPNNPDLNSGGNKSNESYIDIIKNIMKETGADAGQANQIYKTSKGLK